MLCKTTDALSFAQGGFKELENLGGHRIGNH